MIRTDWVGELLHQQRRHARLSVLEIALALEISEATVRRIERGTAEPRFGVALRWLQACQDRPSDSRPC